MPAQYGVWLGPPVLSQKGNFCETSEDSLRFSWAAQLFGPQITVFGNFSQHPGQYSPHHLTRPPPSTALQDGCEVPPNHFH